MKKSADISSCGRYRFSLTRQWDDDKPNLVFLMLNPSTADSEQDDPTIRRCIGFAEREDRGGIIVVNLYPLRTPSPRVLFEQVGSIEERAWTKNVMKIAAVGPGSIVCAWGSNGSQKFMHECVLLGTRSLLREADLKCLGTDKNGNPRHPLYLKKDAKLIEWRPVINMRSYY